jgi:hypothetical protein
VTLQRAVTCGRAFLIDAVEEFLTQEETAAGTDENESAEGNDSDLDMCIAYIKHEHLIAQQQTVANQTTDGVTVGCELWERIVCKFPRSWRLHSTLSSAWRSLPRVIDGPQSQALSDSDVRRFGSFTLTYTVLHTASILFESCMPDTACCFLASILQSSDLCPVSLQESLRRPQFFPDSGVGTSRSVSSGSDSDGIMESMWALTDTEHLFLGISISKLLYHFSAGHGTEADRHVLEEEEEEEEGQSSGLQHDVVWASFLFLLFTGESLGTSMMLDSELSTSEFEPNYITWYE